MPKIRVTITVKTLEQPIESIGAHYDIDAGSIIEVIRELSKSAHKFAPTEPQTPDPQDPKG